MGVIKVSKIEVNEVHKRILTLKKNIDDNYLKLGGYLKLVSDRKLY